MVDTKTQYQKIKKEVDAAVLEVMESSMFIGGNVVNTFAENLARYNGSKHCIPCANGTDALQIAMMALGLEPGDEVIVPSFTYIATVEVAGLLRIKPVFVEVDKRTFCIDPASLEKAITPKTRAIVPVHLYGHAADMETIMSIAARHNLYVIEDNAQAIGCDYTFSDGTVKKTGSIGHIGCTSFYPSKNLGAFGDGGAMFTDNDEFIAARRKIAYFYDKAFAENKSITIPFREGNNKHVFHQYTLILNGVDRDGLSQYLTEQGVPNMIYYPVPAHRQKMFDAFGGSSYDLPLTDWLTERVISLPIHTELDEEQQNFIVSKVLEFVNR